jgi:hypothetical protein
MDYGEQWPRELLTLNRRTHGCGESSGRGPITAVEQIVQIVGFKAGLLREAMSAVSNGYYEDRDAANRIPKKPVRMRRAIM